jgi:glyoxylase-like metal-dependent hydrolase (beta-lactamase superfamily II)
MVDPNCNGELLDVEDGVKRITFKLPLGIDHVHCYLLRALDGSWILVDTGLGSVDAEATWRPVLDALDAPVERIVVTHAHPDHVGGAAEAAALTGATVFQGRIDNARGEAIWGRTRVEGLFDEFQRAHGVPEGDLGTGGLTIRLPSSPQLLDEGDAFDGWRVLVLPGHADGHIVLERDGLLVAGDTILGTITPHVGVYPRGRDDPLADYVQSLERIAELRPRLALPGHGPLLADAAGRAREIAAHHADRLDTTAATLAAGPRTAHEVSAAVFEHVPVAQMRFALTETVAHLERLVRLGRARRLEGHPVRFAA